MAGGIQQGPFEKPYGIAYIGEKATIVADRRSFQVYPEWDGETDSPKTEPRKFTEGRESHNLHALNFLECIKSRETPICPPESGRIAALYAHIPNIAGRVGAPVLHWDDTNQKFLDNKDANQLISPEYRSPWKLPTI